MTRRKKSGGERKPKRRRPPPVSRQRPQKRSDVDSDVDSDAELPMWLDEHGMHAIVPGRPDAETFERMTEIYQQKIRNSPMWDEMVRQFGIEKAERLLKQCRAQPG